MASALNSQFENATSTQSAAATRALRYLKGTERYRLILRLGQSDQLRAHLDESRGGESGTSGSSQSGVIIKYWNASIFITSCLQKPVFLGTPKAEYTALLEAERDIVWFRNAPNELLTE